MNTVVDVLPNDCVGVGMGGDDWGVLYDKAVHGSVWLPDGKDGKEVADGDARVLVPLVEITSEALGSSSKVARIAEECGLDLLLVFSSDGGRIGCMAH